MRWIVLVVAFLLPTFGHSSQSPDLESFFAYLNRLEFEKAKELSLQVSDSGLRTQLEILADLLFYGGQTGQDKFFLTEIPSNADVGVLSINELNEGYLNLFYDQSKGHSFKRFHKALGHARNSKKEYLIKASLLALLRYFESDIAQNSDAYIRYMREFDLLRKEPIDYFWSSVYWIVFYSKSLTGVDERYFNMTKALDSLERSLPQNSPLLTHVFYEQAVRSDGMADSSKAKRYYKMAFKQAGPYPFQRRFRFFSAIKLMTLNMKDKEFSRAHQYLAFARSEVDLSDTMRSNYHLNLHESFLWNAEGKNDRAFKLLKKAYAQDFQLDFRRNTLEINRLSVQLETQEKENLNLLLRQQKMWLVVALAAIGLLLLLSYVGYIKQKSKNKIQQKDKEVQSMRIEKILKDQELFGIDWMIAGQEKERQRIANDLHDNLGSLLATIKLHVDHLRSGSESVADKESILAVTDNLLGEAYQKVRGIAHRSNAGVLAQDGLIPTVTKFASKASIANKFSITVKAHSVDDRLNNSLEISIFRIIQELVTNVIKHSNASEATIHMTQHFCLLNIMVEDNGIGFEASQVIVGNTMGLYSIRKRIENMKGTMTIDSSINKGTTVILDIPLT